MNSADYSAEFYRHHSRQYAQVSEEFRQSVYIKSSHRALNNDWDAWERLKQLTHSKPAAWMRAAALESAMCSTPGQRATM